MRVVHLTRPAGAGDHSLERCFEAVRKTTALARYAVDVVRCPNRNQGVGPRLRNCVNAWKRRGDVNHILGDIHYVCLFLPRKRTVLTVLDCRVAYHPSRIRRFLLTLFWLTIPVRRVARICAISESTRQEILRLTGIGGERVDVIPVCIPDRLQAQERPFRADRPRILQVGTRANKNVPRLIAALAELACELHLVGPLDAEIRAELRRAGIPWRHSEELSDEAMAQAYEDCDVVAFVSTYEGFGMPIVEAQAVGRVVVTSRIEPMVSVSGGAALFADPLDTEDIRRALRQAIADEQGRQDLIQRGFVNARKYRPETVASAYQKIYEEVGAA